MKQTLYVFLLISLAISQGIDGGLDPFDDHPENEDSDSTADNQIYFDYVIACNRGFLEGFS